MPRNSTADAARTRETIVSRAVELGSVEGLEAVSLGRLAGELGLSKGGVIGPFGSKEELQLAAIDAANRRFRQEVWDPAVGRPPGLARLQAIMDAWFSYLEREVFPGGCFLTAASIEFDDRPGAVRDAVAAGWATWVDVLAREVEQAQRTGELADPRTPRAIVFELHGHVMAGNWAKQLFADTSGLAAGRAAVARLLGA